ncbi:META domain-containing protein [Salinicola aestuarinus]|uniref:META domain-containing protein n=1 Tax=Salinicola aestuarinus TaxID=1949082 RepID=UPI00130030A2|nr:META domain-containing protein [Salinicola aestuarinus]
MRGKGLLMAALLGLLTACAGQFGGTPETAQPAEALVGTYWKLMTLDGERVTVAADQREAHMVLDAHGRVTGSTGCNRLVGSYTLEGQRLEFSQVATTRMACPGEVGTLERDWTDALSRTARLEQTGKRLILEDADGQSLAELKATALY